jgi:hypothetical protein
VKVPRTASPLAAAAAALLLALSGCATPDAVRQFVTTARDAAWQFSPFVEDIADSCVRRKLSERPATEIADVSERVTAACKEDFDLAPDLLGSMQVPSGAEAEPPWSGMESFLT